MPYREGSATAPFVGRVAELAACERALDRMETTGFHLVEIVGDPGVGKSRLLAEIADRAELRGIVVARAQATEYEQDVPFGTVVGGFAEAITRCPPPGLPFADRRVLAALFPGLGSDSVPAPRHLIQGALLRLLEEAGAQRPLVTLHDDLHWIDESTIEMVGRLLRHPPDVPLLNVIAYRRRQAPPAFIATLRDYAGDRLTTIELGPLSLTESAQLLDLAPDSERLFELHRESHGNPFYLDILARHENGTLPRDVRAGILAELAGLSSQARRFIDAAAVTGEPFDAPLIARVAGETEDAALTAVDELAVRDLIHSGTGSSLRFRHELVRQAVYDELNVGQRTLAHRRAAAALTARGAPPGVTARHIAAYATPGDLPAIDALRLAGADALGSAPATAARWFDAALQLLPHGAPERLQLLSALAMAYGMSGRLREGRDALHEVLASDSFELRRQAVAFCATLERLLGRHDEARAILLAELGRMSGDSPEAFDILLELGSGALLRWEDGTAWTERALAMARRLGLVHLQAAASALRLETLCARGSVASALEALPETVILVDSLPDQRLAERLDAAEWLGWSEIMLGNPREASRHLVRGRDLAQTSGQSYRLPHLLIALAMARAWQGELTWALTLADEARELAIVLASDELRWIVEITKSLVSSWRGDHEAAVRSAGEALNVADQVGGCRTPMTRAISAFARLGLDNSLAAADELAAACSAVPPGTVHILTELLWYEALSEAYCRLGRPDAAAAWSDRAAARGCSHIPLHRGLMLLTAAHCGSPDSALEAAGEFDAAGARVWAARAQLSTGLLLGDDDRDRALSLLASATGVFASYGALGRHDEAVRAQRRLGVRVPRTGSPSVSLLSTREIQVARLVAHGLTNRDIARRLYISPRTVETHLAHVFAKLGVRSRAELIGRLGDL